MELELEFSGTKNTQAKVCMKVKKDGDVIYEQEAVIESMYGYIKSIFPPKCRIDSSKR